ncbi:MAG: penicillin acylase family protein [Bacteroidetes bacterium]|nr:penicillin acylase family protein [Bacteroidota bacterium]
MNKVRLFLFGLLFALPFFTFSQAGSPKIDPLTVTISRDEWGVPHIHAKTDAGTAYGLAWANAEDNFHDMQLNMLMARARQGEVLGKNGAIVDFAVQMLRVRELVRDRYEAEVSPEFKRHLEAYSQGVNEYAAMHPEAVPQKAVPRRSQGCLGGLCGVVGADGRRSLSFSEHPRRPCRRTDTVFLAWVQRLCV